MAWFSGFIIILLTLILTFALTYFLIIFTKSYRVRLRDPLNNSKYISDIWVMEKIDKTNGLRIWKNVPLLFPKLKVERPEDKVINVGNRGRLYAEAYRISEDEFVWITDEGINADTIITSTGKTFAKSFKPFTHSQRQVLIHQNIKAEEINRKNKWSTAEILQFAMFGGFILLGILAIVFAGDILAEWRGVQGQQAGITENLGIVTNNLAAVSTALGYKIPELDVKVTQNVGAEPSGGIVQKDETPPKTNTTK